MNTNNLVIKQVTKDIIDVYSYNRYILELRGKYLRLNIGDFNQSTTNYRHFTNCLGKIFHNRLVALDKVLKGYKAIKSYIELNPNNNTDNDMLIYQVKHYIESLGYSYDLDCLGNVWVVIKLK